MAYRIWRGMFGYLFVVPFLSRLEILFYFIRNRAISVRKIGVQQSYKISGLEVHKTEMKKRKYRIRKCTNNKKREKIWLTP